MGLRKRVVPIGKKYQLEISDFAFFPIARQDGEEPAPFSVLKLG